MKYFRGLFIASLMKNIRIGEITFLYPPSVRSLARRQVSLPGGGGFSNGRPGSPLPKANGGRKGEDWLPSLASAILKDKTFLKGKTKKKFLCLFCLVSFARLDQSFSHFPFSAPSYPA